MKKSAGERKVCDFREAKVLPWSREVLFWLSNRFSDEVLNNLKLKSLVRRFRQDANNNFFFLLSHFHLVSGSSVEEHEMLPPS